MAAVMIGVDPHKASRTAVAIDSAEVPLGTIRVRASARQAGQLVEWAADWPERTWAAGGGGGLGHLLAQQLVAAGERVIDVQPKLGARVRLLSTGTSNKNDPNGARSVAVAALRSPGCHQVTADDHATVLRVWSRRHRQLSSLRTQAACRLHAALCELVPGGVARNITASRAAAIPGQHMPDSDVALAWHALAADHLADLRRIDGRIADTMTRLTAAVKASGTTLTEVFGVGPVIAATVLGDVADPSRFPDADKFASYNGTAPIEVSSGSRKICRLSDARQPPPLPRHPHGRRHPDRPQAQRRPRLLPAQTQGRQTPSEARRALKRKISNAIYARLQADARARAKGPGGQPGNDSASSAAGSHPARQLFGPATPGPATYPPLPYAPQPGATPGQPHRHPAEQLDKQKGLDMGGFGCHMVTTARRRNGMFCARAKAHGVLSITV